MLHRLLLILFAVLLGACSSVSVEDYRNDQPGFILEDYFNGPIEAWGLFQKRDGKVVKRFKVDIDASWVGNKGVLDERFSYSDGSKQRRVWYITRHADMSYSGTAADVEGQATGIASGNALHWQYTLRLPVDDAIYHVQFDDWMYLMEDGVLINRAVMKKFGFELGQVTLFFRKKH